jgi:uncharacterized protein (UPF0264 family)
LKLLVSPKNEAEAIEAIAGGADIIDVKNPKEGPLGANFPWVIKRIVELAPEGIEVSCTIGEMPNLPGSISLAAFGAATIGVNYVKAGLSGLGTTKDAIYYMQNVAKAAKEYNPSIKVVVSGYADASRIKTVEPSDVPFIARKAHADFAMIDTAIKDGKNLFDYLSKSQLQDFVDTTHSNGLKAALAGSLQKEHLQAIYAFGTDVAGLRGAACTFNDRFNGKICREKVRELAKAIVSAKKL